MVSHSLLLIEKNKIHNKYIMKTPSYDAKNGLCVPSWPLKENNQLKTHARKPKGIHFLVLYFIAKETTVWNVSIFISFYHAGNEEKAKISSVYISQIV